MLRTNINKWKEEITSWSRRKQIAAGIGSLIGLLFVFLLILRILVGWGVFGGIPSDRELSTIANPLSSELYDRNGVLLGRYYVENRSRLTADDLNEFYRQALVATEDHRFYDHGGVDYRSLLRVFFKTILLQKDASGGGSTITQQLAKNLYPRKKYWILGIIVNKLREMEIAGDLEDIYSKEEIMLMYSNTVSFGERAFGLKTASQRFFNKTPKDLLLEEAATLVGILKGTNYYSPRKYPERARARRNVVLGQLARHHYITEETAAQLSALPLKLDYQPPTVNHELARYFKERVRKDFQQWSLENSKSDGSKYDIYKDGLKIYSTLDMQLQSKAEDLMVDHMRGLQKTFLDSWKGGRLYGPGTKLIDEKITAHPLYKSLRAAGKNGQEALEAFTAAEDFTFWNWDGYEEKKTTRIDSIKHYLSLLHSSMMAVDPGTGDILVWIGGNDYGEFQWDDVTGPRQVGSTFKPIVYLTALEQGIEPCQEYENELRTYTDYDDWTPRNSSGSYGNLATVKGALTHSINTISVQLLFEVGIPAVVNTARRLGIISPLSEVPSMVLGTSDISLYEMVRAYSVFANRGVKKGFNSILRIEDGSGEVLYEHMPAKDNQGERVIDQETADVLNELLLNVTVKGTGRRVYSNYNIKFPVMGKTGTTQNQSDGWYIGYNEDLVIASWVGTQDRRIHFRNLGTGSGGSTALPMVAGLMEYAGKNGYIINRKARISEITECLDTLSSDEQGFNMIRALEDQIEKLGKEVMGEYYDRNRKSGSDKSQRKRRDKERDRRYREYKKAVEDMERRLKSIKKRLEDG